MQEDLKKFIQAKFAATLSHPPEINQDFLELLQHKVCRASCRNFSKTPISDELIRMIGLRALSAPTKSDLQQGDIIHITAPKTREAVLSLIPSMPWASDASQLLIFCGNGKRLLDLSRARGKIFANDHLDAFLNAAVDSAIQLSAFVETAESIGLGCCPLSVLRDRVFELDQILNLPERVFPLAGLAVGWPSTQPLPSPRLSFDTLWHDNSYDEPEGWLEEYDQRRLEQKPYKTQRNLDKYGALEDYSWSEDKARQYSVPQRADFGTYIRQKGFLLD